MANKHNLGYKIQEINDLKGENIGYEVLINAEGLSIRQADEIYNKGLMFPHSTQRLIRRLERYVEENSQVLFGKNLFINLERSHLCDKFLLCDIVILSRKAAHKNVNVIIEITERDTCGKCPEIGTGINFLNKNNVLLALDDYELNKSDFRYKELDTNVYSFIKVDFASLSNHQEQLDELLEKYNLKLIVEYIESESDRDWVTQHAPETWALQGYLYNTFSAKI
ncbi:EAL domain-containing protein [Vibrio hepatarius]|uniref:EAL domain-containing protein n=1 Tax=Vibrio hepatarius TaxID=171383 RepID=UPI00142DD764|nr:EAL domain-containing protein [Vibrio hepatarius]NIY82530.1 EAL domain-containing protein [Vibrio hepatarius]NVJ56727.1 EAL domain-containing protein [Vibrionaceae bacterium]